MKQKKVWRYYCDHCKKSGCGKAAMLKHERHCLRNDERECRMCASLNGATNLPMAELVAAANESLEKLREVSEQCPMCMLAAIMRAQSKDTDDFGAWTDTRFSGFDYQAERTEALKMLNEARYEGVAMGGCH